MPFLAQCASSWDAEAEARLTDTLRAEAAAAAAAAASEAAAVDAGRQEALSSLGAELERSSARAAAVKERAASRLCRLLGSERLLVTVVQPWSGKDVVAGLAWLGPRPSAVMIP